MKNRQHPAAGNISPVMYGHACQLAFLTCRSGHAVHLYTFAYLHLNLKENSSSSIANEALYNIEAN